LPSVDDCSVCHTVFTSFGPGTAMVHTNITNGCASCHAAGSTWYGVTKVVTSAATTAANGNGGSTHIPIGTTDCSGCHSTTNFTVGTGFEISTAPLMSVANHTAVASGGVTACDSCHEDNMTTWLGVGTQIYLRPLTTASTTSVVGALTKNPDTAHTASTTQDCAGCHSTAPPFSNATSFPTGHIPVVSGTACTTCHTTGAFNVVTLPMPHTGVVSGTCGSCHGSGASGTGYIGPFAGPVFTPAASGGGGTFGTYTAGQIAFVPKQVITSPAVGTSGGHIPLPTGDDCSTCHTAFTSFGPGTAMVHTNITANCASCHTAGMKWYGVASLATTTGGGTGGSPATLSPVHVPITSPVNSDCGLCHGNTVFTRFGTTTKVPHASTFITVTGTTGGRNNSAVSNPTCKSCHTSGDKWYGVSLSTATVGSHQSSTSSQDCINCHSETGSSFGGAAAAAAAKRIVRAANGPALRPVGLPYSHLGVLSGTCASCHAPNGTATAMPANHLPTLLSCDSCHRTTAWLPALFGHAGVAAGSCANCHTGNWATPKPTGHMLTNRTCDTCHHSTTSWTPETYSHLDAIYSPHPASVQCVACHITNTEQVVWKYPNLKPGCAGCHGPQFGGAAAIRRSKGPAVSGPRGQ